MRASKIAEQLAAVVVTDKQRQAARKAASKPVVSRQHLATRTINLTPAAFVPATGEDPAILAARRLVPALAALIALFPGDCSDRRTDYHHRDESPDTQAERARRSGRLQACPRITVAEAYAAALRAAS
jgi:hypothetical protein